MKHLVLLTLLASTAVHASGNGFSDDDMDRTLRQSAMEAQERATTLQHFADANLARALDNSMRGLTLEQLEAVDRAEARFNDRQAAPRARQLQMGELLAQRFAAEERALDGYASAWVSAPWAATPARGTDHPVMPELRGGRAVDDRRAAPVIVPAKAPATARTLVVAPVPAAAPVTDPMAQEAISRIKMYALAPGVTPSRERVIRQINSWSWARPHKAVILAHFGYQA